MNFIFPWILLLLLFLSALFFTAMLFSLKNRKNIQLLIIEPAADTDNGLFAVSVISSYTIVNLEDEIRTRAYELYLERNGQDGDADKDWRKAVPEICARYEAVGFEAYAEDENWWARRNDSAA